MASESSEDASVTLPSDLEEWVDRKAAELGVDRREVVVQLLASYRAAEEFDDTDVTAALNPDTDVETRVREVVADRLPDIAAAVEERVDAAGQERLAAEVDRVETAFDEKVQDVRERVIQVKREADGKADADHSHPEFDELAALSTAVEELEADLESVADRLDDGGDEELRARVDELEETVEALSDADQRLDEVEERLRTVAWVVSDLRDAQGSGTDAVDRLKRAAAAADVSRAVCENCSTAVEIGLLTEPTCPHCDAALGDVQPASGIFGKPKLTVARGLESGEERSNVPDAAQEGR